LRQRQVKTEDSKERERTKKDSSTKRSKEDRKSKKQEPPAEEARMSAGSEDEEQFEHITEPPGVDLELDAVHGLAVDGERKDQVIRETDLDELSDATADRETDMKPNNTELDRFASESADTVKDRESTKDSTMADKSSEKMKKTMKEKKRTEREDKPTTEANQLKFSSEQAVDEDSFNESDHDDDVRPPTVTVPQPQSKYQLRDDDYDSDVEQPDDEPASLALRQRQVKTEDSKERERTKKDSSTKRSKEDTKSKKREPPAAETRLSAGSDDKEQFEHITQPPSIPHIRHDVEETNLDEEFELSDEEVVAEIDEESLELPVKRKRTIENGEDGDTTEQRPDGTQPQRGRTRRDRKKRHEPDMRPTIPLETELDRPIDANGSLGSDGEEFSVVPQIPDARISSRYSTGDEEDQSDDSFEDTQALREADERKMRNVLTNGYHEPVKPVDREPDKDVDMDDLSPSPTGQNDLEEEEENEEISREDLRHRTTSDSVKEPGRRSGPGRTRRSVGDRKERGKSVSDDEDERTTTTKRSRETTTTWRRTTTTEQDVDRRRHRPRSAGGRPYVIAVTSV